MPQEAKAPGNARDMLTWGRYTRRHRCRRREGLRQTGAWAHSGLKTGRNVHLQTCSCQASGASNCLQWRACNRGSCTEEPDEGSTGTVLLCPFTSGSGAAVGWVTAPPTLTT